MKAPLSIHKATFVLTIIWGGSFAIGLAVLATLFFANAILAVKIPEFLAQLSAIYAPYLGAMLVYFFATRKKTQRASSVNRIAFQVALVTSILWNLVVISLLVRVLEVLKDEHSRLTIDSALAIARDSGACLSWIASPVIGFFFAKPSSEEK